MKGALWTVAYYEPFPLWNNPTMYHPHYEACTMNGRNYERCTMNRRAPDDRIDADVDVEGYKI